MGGEFGNLVSKMADGHSYTRIRFEFTNKVGSELRIASFTQNRSLQGPSDARGNNVFPGVRSPLSAKDALPELWINHHWFILAQNPEKVSEPEYDVLAPTLP